MNTLTFHPALSAVGRRRRAASLKQVVNHAVAGFVHRAWAALEAYGERRAAATLLRQANLLDGEHPALAQELRFIARRADCFNRPADTPASPR